MNDLYRPEPLDRTDLRWAFGIVVVAIAFQWPIYDRWLALQDEGYILGIADELNRGRVLYRDVTSDAPFPGAFYLLSWWFRLVGSSVENSRFLAVGGFALYCAAIFRISRELLSRQWCLGLIVALLCYRVWAFPHWQIYSYSLVSAVAMTIATALVCAYRRKGTLGFLVTAGLCAGIGILSKQNYGLAVTGSLGLALLLLPWLTAGQRPGWGPALKPGATLGLAALAIIVPSLFYFVYEGALDEMIDQTFVFPFTLMAERSFTTLPDLWPLFGQDSQLRGEIGSYFPAILATLWWYPCSDCFVSDMSRGPLYQSTAFWDVTLKLLYWAPLLLFYLAAAIWGLRILQRRRRGEPPGDGDRRLILLAFAGGFLLAFNKPRDWVHLMMVYPPSLLVGTVLLYDTMRVLPGKLRRASLVLLLLGMTSVSLVTLALMWDFRRQIDWPLDMARGGVYADRQNGPIIQDVVEYMERAAPPTEPVPVYPIQPMLGFLAGRRTAGGYYVVWPSQNPGRDRAIIDDFVTEEISHVIYSVSQFEHLGAFRDNAPLLFSYLVKKFEVERVFSLEPKGPVVLGLRKKSASRIRYRMQLMRHAKAMPWGHPGWATWPFAEVMTKRVNRPIRLSVDVPVPQTVLSFEYGVNPERWLDAEGGPFVFQVAVKELGEATEEIVFESRMDPARDVRDRPWRYGQADLAKFVGRTVVLSFRVKAERPVRDPRNLAGWQELGFIRPFRKRESTIERSPQGS